MWGNRESELVFSCRSPTLPYANLCFLWDDLDSEKLPHEPHLLIRADRCFVFAFKACAPITSRCGDRGGRLPRKWNNVCVGDSNQPTIVGAWTKLMCALN